MKRMMVFHLKRRGIYACLCGLLVFLVAINGVVGRETIAKEQTSVNIISMDAPMKGIWLNYMEFAALINRNSQEEYIDEMEKVLLDIKLMGFNTIFLHVRSHSDSFYPSNIFPWSQQINQGKGVDYDPLALFIAKAHANQLRVHAWFNPYRISSESVDTISKDNPAFAMRKDGNQVVQAEQGVYYNPCSPKVRQLVLSGVREVLERYDVDGIQYDDYFYPTQDESFDSVAYQQYCDITKKPLPLADWRRAQVNMLISGTYQLTHGYGVPFGVSPSADIQKNRESLYADVAAWVEGGYVDYICPQLYFGFEHQNESMRFDHLLRQWELLGDEIMLYIGLASYKVGTEDGGSDEWQNHEDLLLQQGELVALSSVADGIGVYHYASLMKNDALSLAQRQNLQGFLQRYC